MTITLREMLETINKQVEEKPEILDYPVFVTHPDMCVIFSEVKVDRDWSLTSDDIDDGNFDVDDIGRKFFELSVK